MSENLPDSADKAPRELIPMRHRSSLPPGGGSPSKPPVAAEGNLSLRERFFRLVPAFDSLRTYSPRLLFLDTMAGLTVAAVAVPQAMAYAQIAAIPPQYGLYTAIVMTT